MTKYIIITNATVNIPISKGTAIIAANVSNIIVNIETISDRMNADILLIRLI